MARRRQRLRCSKTVVICESVVYIWALENVNLAPLSTHFLELKARYVLLFLCVVLLSLDMSVCMCRAPSTCNVCRTLHVANACASTTSTALRDCLFVCVFLYVCLYVCVYSFDAIGCSLRFFETTKEYIDCKCCTQRQPMSSAHVLCIV